MRMNKQNNTWSGRSQNDTMLVHKKIEADVLNQPEAGMRMRMWFQKCNFKVIILETKKNLKVN